jgi:aconitate hydratase
MAPGTEGGWTTHQPDGAVTTIYDAAMQYKGEGVPLLVIAGKEYGSGSSRDWAAKGTLLLGVTAVIAESFERIHRSNLIGMGVLPLQYLAGESAASLGIAGTETFEITGIAGGIEPGKRVRVLARSASGEETWFDAVLRVDGDAEVEYVRHGGILQMVLREMLAKAV